MTRSITGSEHPLCLPLDVTTGGLSKLAANHGLIEVIFSVGTQLLRDCRSAFEIHVGAGMEKDSNRDQHDADRQTGPGSHLPKRSDRSVVQFFRRFAREESLPFCIARSLLPREVFSHLLDGFERIAFCHGERSAASNFIRNLRLQIPKSGESLVRNC